MLIGVSVAGDVASEIMSKLPNVKRGSLRVFGDIFGGRVDNIHVVTFARAEGEPARLVVTFNEGETLEVWDPEGAVIEPHTFRIATASRVRWEWFYYGREKAPANRYFIEHLREGDTVLATTDVDWAPHRFEPTTQQPAVELVGSF
ncbi:MAG: hypothetical protein J2P57_16555 [Acidimicrobiaceae bacterium]|nr:hypothetical protein [Acidimicrobiaceae bacterium]